VAAPDHLIDSNILLRISRRDDPDHFLVDTALARLARDGATLYYTHQNVAEFWNVATRPVERNGFG
jgi:predicted nucleic acid-binding protein